MTKAFTDDNRTVYRSTYRYLRWVMVAALVALFLSVLIQSLMAGCWLGSVSAYYYTPARTVFVGALIVFGSALIAYKGRAPEEDVALNFAGYMAIVVAMVPTTEDDLCPASGFGQIQIAGTSSAATAASVSSRCARLSCSVVTGCWMTTTNGRVTSISWPTP